MPLASGLLRKIYKKNTSSNVAIPKYRQAVGHWRVPLHPDCSKFHELKAHTQTTSNQGLQNEKKKGMKK
jgi:hypothetical protein